MYGLHPGPARLDKAASVARSAVPSRQWYAFNRRPLAAVVEAHGKRPHTWTQSVSNGVSQAVRPTQQSVADDEDANVQQRATTLTVTFVVEHGPPLGRASMRARLLDRDDLGSAGAVSVDLVFIPFRKQHRATAKVTLPDRFKLGAVLVSISFSPEWPQGSHLFLDHVIVRSEQGGRHRIAWCRSWLAQGQGPRIFFVNEAHLPAKTPAGLQRLRETELAMLRGELTPSSLSLDGDPQELPHPPHSPKPDTAERELPDRIYDYQTYNDFSGDYDPSADAHGRARPTLGGSARFPYPRRLRTGRPLITGTDAESASKKDAYIPLDERFLPAKQRSFDLGLLKGILPALPEVVKQKLLRGPKQHFRGLADVAGLYRDTWRELSHSLLLSGLSFPLKLVVPPPTPLVIKGDGSQWSTDREFGRQVVAGMHPCQIQALSAEAWAEKQSAIGDEHVQALLGCTLQEALGSPSPQLFCLDYIPLFLSEMPGTGGTIAACINELPDRVQYAARCVLHLNGAGVLLPVAIELIHPDRTDWPRVITPHDHPALWRMAKLHFLVTDASYHQFISHWLRNHCCTEPYILAARRQLSVIHPVMKALHPHFKDTIQADTVARKKLFNAGGIIEQNYNAGPFCMRFSSVVYGREWRFDRQSLPGDLIFRGMAVPVDDSNGVGSSDTIFTWKGAKFSIVMGTDYPYAADGLLIWNALHAWFMGYLSLYYKDDKDVQSDAEVAAWWGEIQEKGHPDKREGWPELHTLTDLVDILTTMAWIASAHHGVRGYAQSAVNYGQYAYAGFMPNYPISACQPLPHPCTPEYESLTSDPDRFMLESLSGRADAMQMMGVYEALSTHDAGEEFLGQRADERTWTSDPDVIKLKRRFQEALEDEVQDKIKARNSDPGAQHRYVGYELQLPFLPRELRKKNISPCSTGVPNSIAI